MNVKKSDDRKSELARVIDSGNYDLHVHTNASDGDYPPKEVVLLAKKSGLSSIAITDHDTTNGIREAMEAGAELGLRVIPGVEITSFFEGIEVHVLGYFIDEKDKSLNQRLSLSIKSRFGRAEKSIELLAGLGVPITKDDVLKFSGKEYVGRPHIAKALVAKGHVKDTQEAFDKYLAEGKPAFVPREDLPTRDAVSLIHAAGGLAVLGHPGLLKKKELLEKLLELEFDGIEAWHSEHKKEDAKRFLGIAKARGLIATGGSDFHCDEKLGGFNKEVLPMEKKATNVVWHQHSVTKEERHNINGHKSCVLWFTGLPSSGKSTLANEVAYLLFQKKIHSYVLDGDNIRHGLNKNLGFSPDDRKENIRRIGEVAKLFVDAGIFALTAFISPYREDRDSARALLPKGEFVEIYVKCPVDVCEKRDPKGLYKKAKNGEIKEFTGVSAPYEHPLSPEIVIETDKHSIEESAKMIFEYLRKTGYIK